MKFVKCPHCGEETEGVCVSVPFESLVTMYMNPETGEWRTDGGINIYGRDKQAAPTWTCCGTEDWSDDLYAKVVAGDKTVVFGEELRVWD